MSRKIKLELGRMRKQGRPKLKWKDKVDKDLREKRWNKRSTAQVERAGGKITKIMPAPSRFKKRKARRLNQK